MSNGTKTLLAVIVILILVWIGYAVVNSSNDSGSTTATSTPPVLSGEPIKLGFMGPLSGDLASLGEAAKIAADLAVADVNAAGGISGRPLQLLVEDSKCLPDEATSAITKLISVDQVLAVVGGLCSSESAPAAPVAQAAATPMMTYCSSAPGITKVGDYIFRDYPSDKFQARVSADYAFNGLGKKKAAVLYIKNDWGQGMRDGFVPRYTELGGKVVLDESFAQDVRDFRTIMTKVKAAKPDIVLLYAFTESGVPALIQIKQLGLTVPVLGGDASDDPKLLEGAKDAAEGFQFTAAHASIPEDFKARFMAASGGKEAKICAPQAYDAVRLFAQIMGQVGTDKAAVREALSRTAGYQGVSGDITFDNDGDILAAIYDVKQVKQGKAEVLTTITAQAGSSAVPAPSSATVE